MGLIAQETVRQVIDRADIVDVISRYTTLKKAGSNFKALCPFHHEKTPSFVVNPDKQIFHCFGCGVGGNNVSFIMRQERLEFPEAIRFLAQMVGIDIVEEDNPQQQSYKKLKEDIYQVNRLALEFFHQLLLTSREPSAKVARDYLKGRGVDLDTVKKFQLGFASDTWDGLIVHLKSKGITLEMMQQAGLIIAKEKGGFYDRFRNRIIFPIFDINSHPVAFGARAMEETQGAKYINSPETPIYTKGRHLYGLNLTKQSVSSDDQILIVEGYMDMIMPFVFGVTHIAASLGTALTVDQIRLIRRYTHNVVMLFDTDPAGQNAIIRSLDLLIDEGMNVKVVTLKADEDPDSFIRESGLNAFNERLKQAYSLFEYKFNWLSAQHDLHSIEGKAKISQEMLSTINRFKNEVAKFELMRLLANKLDVPEEVITKQSGAQLVTKQKKPEAVPVRTHKQESPNPQEELLIALFLDDHQWAVKAKSSLKIEDFTMGLTQDIVGHIWQLTDQQLDWQLADLIARLNNQEAINVITKLVSESQSRTSDSEKLFNDALLKMNKANIKRKLIELNSQLQEAVKHQNVILEEDIKIKINELLKMKV